jgi:hypothetical protein|tara:strand:- start:815 stop:1579 length:765 start_codon:yes stop_codon:yes gene_type:complete
MKKLYDKSKKGTIILSHYRSGGTQLKLIISNVLRANDMGELDFDLETTDLKKDFYSKLSEDSYSVTLVNNPIVISWISNNKDVFEYLEKNFHIVGLKRKDNVKCLLSLGLWERLIASGLFESYDLWTKENMEQFHKSVTENLLPPKEVGIGYRSIVESNHHSHHNHLHQIVKIYLDELSVLETLCSRFEVDMIHYEDYEFNKKFLVDYFPNICDAKKTIEDTYLGKIPYVSSDYLVYYEDSVRKILKSWGVTSD